MPIYEYRSQSSNSCILCKSAFEVRQKINDKHISECPRCGQPVERLFSRSSIAIMDTLSANESYRTHTQEDADRLGLDRGFAEDQIWE